MSAVITVWFFVSVGVAAAYDNKLWVETRESGRITSFWLAGFPEYFVAEYVKHCKANRIDPTPKLRMRRRLWINAGVAFISLLTILGVETVTNSGLGIFGD